MEMVLGVGAGAVLSTALTPMVVGGVSRLWAGAASPGLRPVWTLVTGGLLATAAGMAFRGKKKISSYMLVGAGVSVAIDLLNRYLVPMMPGIAGYGGMGDYVQLPYSGPGMGDYVQLPYSGYGGMGTQAQVEAGSFGTPAQVEAGSFGANDGTFAQSF